MSRSNPQANAVHPCEVWIEWDGTHGNPRRYDKKEKKNIPMKLPLSFILLDTLAGVTGWDERSKSGIVSNEVRDSRTDIMNVRSFKGGTIATGVWSDIRERVAYRGGCFSTNLYIAIRVGGEFKIASIRLAGAALNQWIEFQKASRNLLFEKGVLIKSYTEGKKGNITFRTPVFELVDCPLDANEAAIKLDKVLQAYLNEYLKKPTGAPAPAGDPASQPDAQENHDQEPPDPSGGGGDPFDPSDDDVPL